MEIKINVTLSESVPVEKVNKVITNVVKKTLDQDGWMNGINTTECIRLLSGKVAGWVVLSVD